MNTSYSTSIFWSDEDNGFIVLIPEFPGLSAFGETREKATKEAKIALEGMLELYKEEGNPLPAPRHLPEHSGQLRIRISKALHGGLASEAERQGVSLNALIQTYLTQGLTLSSVDSCLERVKKDITDICVDMRDSWERVALFTVQQKEKTPYLSPLQLYDGGESDNNFGELKWQTVTQ